MGDNNELNLIDTFLERRKTPITVIISIPSKYYILEKRKGENFH